MVRERAKEVLRKTTFTNPPDATALKRAQFEPYDWTAEPNAGGCENVGEAAGQEVGAGGGDGDGGGDDGGGGEDVGEAAEQGADAGGAGDDSNTMDEGETYSALVGRPFYYIDPRKTDVAKKNAGKMAKTHQ